MSNKDKFLKLVKSTDKTLAKKVRGRVANAEMLKESKRIAMKVLIRIDDLGWKQKDLADRLNVSPQHVSKMLKGEENFTLDTLVKLQSLLAIPLLASAEGYGEGGYEIIAECSQNVDPFDITDDLVYYNITSQYFRVKLKANQELESGRHQIY